MKIARWLGRADQLDEASNVDEVADCMENAKDCSAAVTCLSKAKK